MEPLEYSNKHKYINERLLPTRRTVLLLGAISGIGMCVAVVPGLEPVQSHTITEQTWFIATMVFFAGIALLVPILIVWRILAWIIWGVRITTRPRGEYIDIDAIATIRTHITDPDLIALSDNQLKTYIIESTSDASMDMTYGGRSQNPDKLLANLEAKGIHLDMEQLYDLIEAEEVYLKQIGLMI